MRKSKISMTGYFNFVCNYRGCCSSRFPLSFTYSKSSIISLLILLLIFSIVSFFISSSIFIFIFIIFLISIFFSSPYLKSTQSIVYIFPNYFIKIYNNYHFTLTSYIFFYNLYYNLFTSLLSSPFPKSIPT